MDVLIICMDAAETETPCPSMWSLQASNRDMWKFTTIMHPSDIQKMSSINNEKYSKDVELARTSQPRDELRDKSALLRRKSLVTLIKGFLKASVVLSTSCSVSDSASFK